MAKCYIESRTSAARGTDSIAADVVRHLHTREHLGKAAIICDQPLAVLAVARKQWLKISRSIQRQRASTLNADKILKFTHTITHMQHMHFSTKSPLEQPDANFYFLRPHDLSIMPLQCWSVYILSSLGTSTAQTLLMQIPSEALIVDYTHTDTWRDLDVAPKSTLEKYVVQEWRQVEQFLRTHNIAIELLTSDIQDVDTMDDALDTLLSVNRKFLHIANEFQRTLELARPLRLTKETRARYDAVVLLAHRVQALSPGAFTQRFLETYNEDDTFFLYDHRKLTLGGETLEVAFGRHAAAGRLHLAEALRTFAARQDLKN